MLASVHDVAVVVIFVVIAVDGFLVSAVIEVVVFVIVITSANEDVGLEHVTINNIK